MKKDLFWKIMAIIFLCWLFLWLWNSSIVIYKLSDAYSMKFNKITGKVDYLTKEGWKDWEEKFKKQDI